MIMRGIVSLLIALQLAGAPGGSIGILQNGKIAGTGRLGGSVIILVSLDVQPVTTTINVGSTQTYIANGTFSDGSQQDLTGSATWLTSNPVTASISSAPSTFICNAAGTVTITALIGGIQDFATLTCQGIVIVPPVQIVTNSLPGGQVGVSYSANIGVINGTPPYQFSVISGALPPPLSLDPSTGNIGPATLTLDGTYTPTIKVTDSAVPPTSDQHTYSITVTPAAASGNLAELPRAYPNPDECAAPLVTKSVCTSGDHQCLGGPGDYTATTSGLNQCLIDGVADGRDWMCRVSPGIEIPNVVLPIRAPSATSCITIGSSAPIVPFNYTAGQWGQKFMQQYVDGGSPTGRSNSIDNLGRWVATSTGNNVGSAAILTATPDLNGNVAHHYQILDTEIRPATSATQTFVLVELGRNDTTQTLVNQQPHDIFLRRFFIHGDDTHDIQHAVQMQGHDLAILDGVCRDIHFTGNDNQCASGNNGVGIYSITNSYLEAASENIIWGGSFSSIPGIEANCDIYMAGLYVTKNINWYNNGHVWNVKNGLEEKTGCRHLFEKNRVRNVWADGQAGGCWLWSVRFINDDQTLHDLTMRNNITDGCGQFFNGIDGGSDGAGNGQSPSLGADFLSIYNNLAYDIGSNRFKRVGGAGGINAQGVPVLAQNQKFGADSAAITSQTKDVITGLVTVVLAAVPPQIVPGLSAVVAGSTNTFDGTFKIFQVLSPTSFIYTGAAGGNASSTGGTATFPCTSVSDGSGNITTNCPDTNCGLRSPCNGGLEIRPGEYVNTGSCSNTTFQVTKAIAAPLGNPHSLAITYPWATVQPNSTSQCTLFNHTGSPRHLYYVHNGVYMRDGAGDMLQSSPQAGNAPLMRDAIVKNDTFVTESSSVFGMITGGHSDGTSSELFAWDTTTSEIHHLVLQHRTFSNFTEWLTAGGPGITPPTTIYTPANIPCGGTPDATCMGFAGNYAYPNPDAGGVSNALTCTAGVCTATIPRHDLSPGMVMQASLLINCFPNCTKFNGPVTIATAPDGDTVTFPAAVIDGTGLAILITGHDYHDFKFAANSVFAAGNSQGADDATMMGPDIDAIDAAMIDPTHPTPGGGGGGGGATLTSLSPTQGFAAGGELITITGTNFTSSTKASFGATAAKTIFLSSTKLIATAPPGTVGSVSVSINVSGMSAPVLPYLYLFTPTTTCNFAAVGQQDCNITYTDSFGSITRTIRLNNPQLVLNPAVVIYVHGAGGGLFEGSATGWTTKSNTVGFVTVYPQGWPQNTGTKTWNSYYNQATYTEGHPPDDSYFMREIYALLYKNIAIDPKQFFLTGFSAGGHGVYRYAFDDSDIVAAVGPEASPYLGQNVSPGGLLFPSPLANPVSVIHLHGSADGQFLYCGTNNGAVITSSADEIFNFWSGANGNQCATIDTPSTLCTATFGTPTTLTSKKGSACAKGAEVQFYKLANGGHQYYGSGVDMTTPPGTGAAPYNPAFNGIVGQNSIDIFWNFFVAHPKQ